MGTIRHKAWSSSGLIASVERNTLLPANQATYTQSDMLELLNEALQVEVIPFILSLDANYFITTTQIPIIQSASTAFVTATVSSGGGNVAYQLPPDAIGKKLRNVSVVNTQGTIYLRFFYFRGYAVSVPCTSFQCANWHPADVPTCAARTV